MYLTGWKDRTEKIYFQIHENQTQENGIVKNKDRGGQKKVAPQIPLIFLICIIRYSQSFTTMIYFIVTYLYFQDITNLQSIT